MKNRKIFTYTFNVVYVLIVILFVTEEFTRFEINNETLKWMVYNGVLFLTLPILIWNYVVLKPSWIIAILPVLMMLIVCIIGPTKIAFSTSVWKSQAILYVNHQVPAIKIARQTRDMGALGYRTRVVKISYLTSLFALVDTIPSTIYADPEWVEVNEPVR
ncbi:MAG: hypothetical protein REI78_02395 [Pedobacter sp.]|nr:hypothetical protein [Pedobacter sp.]MDQ8051842.1 hypothetical protein [Pedobacter sp.]